MKLYFPTREAARKFAAKSKMVKMEDCGSKAKQGKRWATKLLVAR